jgi:ATP-dependent DNA ligase
LFDHLKKITKRLDIANPTTQQGQLNANNQTMQGAASDPAGVPRLRRDLATAAAISRTSRTEVARYLMLRRRRSCLEPCLPRPAKEPLAPPDWMNEIKHDGFRILARRDCNGVRLYTRNGYNFADRFLRIVDAVKSLPVQYCFIDGEAIVDANGLSTFEPLPSWRHDHAAVLCAFAVIELDGKRIRAGCRSRSASTHWPISCSRC